MKLDVTKRLSVLEEKIISLKENKEPKTYVIVPDGENYIKKGGLIFTGDDIHPLIDEMVRFQERGSYKVSIV